MLTRLTLVLAAVAPLIGYAAGAAWSLQDPPGAPAATGIAGPSPPAHLLRLRARSVEAVDVPGGRMCRVSGQVVEVVHSAGPREVLPGEPIAFRTLCRWDAGRLVPLLTFEELTADGLLEASFLESGREGRLVLRPLSLRRSGA